MNEKVKTYPVIQLCNENTYIILYYVMCIIDYNYIYIYIYIYIYA